MMEEGEFLMTGGTSCLVVFGVTRDRIRLHVRNITARVIKMEAVPLWYVHWL